MNNIVIFPVIFFFLHTSPALQVTPIDWECCGFSKEAEKVFFQNDSLKTIYLIKQRWHTAVVFHTEDIDTTILPEVKYLHGAELIDIGWGDEAFYQHPDFDLPALGRGGVRHRLLPVRPASRRGTGGRVIWLLESTC